VDGVDLWTPCSQDFLCDTSQSIIVPNNISSVKAMGRLIMVLSEGADVYVEP
jgi:hypothetical protein